MFAVQELKELLELSYHEGDFCVAAEWNFFAASCGRSLCDGTGRTVKPVIPVVVFTTF
jgi:hypothetical protein